MGRQYIGEIGKTDNGVVTVPTHLYDGKNNLPLDIELYQPASSLPEGKEDKEFKKKPQLALELIEKSCLRGSRPGIVLIDSGYGNNKIWAKGHQCQKLLDYAQTLQTQLNDLDWNRIPDTVNQFSGLIRPLA